MQTATGCSQPYIPFTIFIYNFYFIISRKLFIIKMNMQNSILSLIQKQFIRIEYHNSIICTTPYQSFFVLNHGTHHVKMLTAELKLTKIYFSLIIFCQMQSSTKSSQPHAVLIITQYRENIITRRRLTNLVMQYMFLNDSVTIR